MKTATTLQCACACHRKHVPSAPSCWNFGTHVPLPSSISSSANASCSPRYAIDAAINLPISRTVTRGVGIETSYREIKQTMLGAKLTLRSKTVDGVYQEIWGTLIAYNLIRLEIAKAALVAKCEPTEVSFVRAFHLIQFELHWAAVTRSYGKLPASMKRLRERLVSLLNDERPDRKFDRAVKAKAQRYTTRILRKPA